MKYALCFLFPLLIWAEGEISIPVDGQNLVTYQADPLAHPAGGKKFKASNFIHPLKTPSGFVLTELQPKDHLHHCGLWWPWKYIEIEGRKVLCWELQKGQGLIQGNAADCQLTADGLVAKSVYIDRKAPGGPQTRLAETTQIQVSEIVELPARGYQVDITITHQVMGRQTVTISPHRYSGFTYRGTALWNKDTSTILTSDGIGRDGANFTPARWVRVEGVTDAGGQAGIVLMSHPSNHNHPEKLRTWDKQVNGSVFINFNPVMDEPWVLNPDKYYTRRYRLFVYDGQVGREEAEALWQTFARMR